VNRQDQSDRLEEKGEPKGSPGTFNTFGFDTHTRTFPFRTQTLNANSHTAKFRKNRRAGTS